MVEKRRVNKPLTYRYEVLHTLPPISTQSPPLNTTISRVEIMVWPPLEISPPSIEYNTVISNIFQSVRIDGR